MVTHGLATLPSAPRGVAWWRFDRPHPALSSASVGGGFGEVCWVVNISVDPDYRRVDLDDHAGEVVADLGLRGAGTALFTAVPMARLASADESGVQVWATVGVNRPTWAADRSALPWAGRRLPAGTINIVVVVPVEVSPSAHVALALAATEAKAQACLDAGVPGTGTASDALVVIAAPQQATVEPFGGVRSTWGARVALAVHTAVSRGLGSAP